VETLKITKKDVKDGKYVAGSVDFNGHIEFDAELGYIFFFSLKATGYIFARAGTGIKAGGCIKAGEGIEAGEGIKAGWGIKAGEYINQSFELLDMSNLKTKRIRFTSSYYHERNFWLAQLEPIKGIDELKDALKDNNKCWSELIRIAKKYASKILAYKYFLPAVRQAIEIMLGD
jgi:hypothetical protein